MTHSRHQETAGADAAVLVPWETPPALEADTESAFARLGMRIRMVSASAPAPPATPASVAPAASRALHADQRVPLAPPRPAAPLLDALTGDTR